MLSEQKWYFLSIARYGNIRMYLCIIIAENQYFCKNIMRVKLDYSDVFVLKCEWLKIFRFNTKIFYSYCKFHLK